MNCFFPSCSDAIKYSDENKSFGFYYSEDPTTTHNMHVHDCCELLLALSPATSFIIDKKIHDVKRGSLFVINQYEAHKISATEVNYFVRYVMQIHPTFLHSNSMEGANLAECFYNASNSSITLTEEEISTLLSMLSELKKDYGFGDALFKKNKATEFLLCVNLLFKTHAKDYHPSTQPETVQKAIEYINTHFTEKISLKDVADNSYISVTQLCRLFSKYCSTTVTKYIISRRITEAKKMLLSGKNVTETAFSCGFDDYANFIRVFKNTVGVPPGKYAKGL